MTNRNALNLEDLTAGVELADGRVALRTLGLSHLATRELLAVRVECTDGSVVTVRRGSALL